MKVFRKPRNNADAGLAGSDYLKEELLPGAQGWYDNVKGVQEGIRGVTESARDQMQGVENVAQAIRDPIRDAVHGRDDDLFD